jgi:hypothetical protein
MRCLLSAVLCAVLLGPASPADAVETSPDTDPLMTDPLMTGALRRVGDGTWSDSDLAYIRTDPAIAGQVADPRDEGVSGAESGRTTTASASTRRRAGSCNWWYRAWFRKRSLLGTTLYVYHHKAVYCRTRSRITKLQARPDWWTDPDSVAYWRRLTDNQVYGTGTARVYSKKQRHIEFCIARYGCYQNFYPWVGLTVRANGNHTYRGSAG